MCFLRSPISIAFRRKTSGPARYASSEGDMPPLLVGKSCKSGEGDAGAPEVADRALAHLVHHVRDHHASVEVDNDERATPAAPEAGASVRPEWRVGRVEPVSDTEAQGH